MHHRRGAGQRGARLLPARPGAKGAVEGETTLGGIVDLEEGVRVALPIHGEAPELDVPMELVVLQFQDGPLFAARPVAG